MTLGLFWDHFGIILEPFWDDFGIILGQFWDDFEISLGSFWDHFGMTLGLFWDHFGIILESEPTQQFFNLKPLQFGSVSRLFFTIPDLGGNRFTILSCTIN